MGKKLAVLGANSTSMSFYKQAHKLGYELYGIGSGDDCVCAPYCKEFFNFSFADKEKLLQVCKDNKIEGVTSFSLESAVPFVYFVARELGLPCNSVECEQLIANKFTMRERLRECNVNVPAYRIVTQNALPADLGFPMIVKPVDSGGSQGVSLICNQREWNDAYELAVQWSKTNRVIAEQYIEGREFSIESISFAGRHYILAITDKVTTNAPHFVELEHHQPANISVEQENAIRKIVLQTLAALKIEYGAAHTELKLNSQDVPYIIELGPRMGGDFITSDLVRLSTGYDFTQGVIEASMGNFVEPTFPYQKFAGVFFLSKETD
ncbi:MAG: ATP-grasp domain-containing protein [Bacteroidales bacterium]|nr:ATP-grasp domain-containing protein [Bacteroidales bacterium]